MILYLVELMVASKGARAHFHSLFAVVIQQGRLRSRSGVDDDRPRLWVLASSEKRDAAASLLLRTFAARSRRDIEISTAGNKRGFRTGNSVIPGSSCVRFFAELSQKRASHNRSPESRGHDGKVERPGATAFPAARSHLGRRKNSVRAITYTAPAPVCP